MTTTKATRTRTRSNRVLPAELRGWYVRTPINEIVEGVRTFVVPASDYKSEYIIKYNSRQRRWACSCADYLHRHSVTGGECKHIHTFRYMLPTLGGLKKLKPGVTVYADKKRNIDGSRTE